MSSRSLVLLACCLASPLGSPAADLVEVAGEHLVPGVATEGSLQPGESASFRVAVPAGEAVLVVAEQRGVDLALAASADLPVEGTPPAEMPGEIVVDRPTGREGPESILLPTRAGEQPYTVELRAFPGGGPGGGYRLAVEHLSAEAAERIEAERLLTRAGSLFHRGGADARREAVDALDRAVELLQRLGRREEEAWALDFLAVTRRSLGDAEAAAESYGRSVALWRALGRSDRETDALAGEGLARLALGDNEAALIAFTRALGLARERGDVAAEANVLNNVCLVRHGLAEWRPALACYRQARELMGRAGNRRGEGVTLTNIGGVHEALGELDEAVASYGEALEIARALGDRTGEARTLNNLALVHATRGETDQALAAYDRALGLFRELGDRTWEARTSNNLGALYRDLGEPARARRHFEQALELRRAVGDRRGESATLNNLAALDEGLGDLAAAIDGYRRSLALAREVEDRRGEAVSLALLGEAYATAGDAKRGLATLGAAIDLAGELDDRHGLARSLHAAAEVRAGRGELEPARQGFLEALAIVRAIRDRPGEVRSLAALAAVELRAGRLEAALGHADAAVERVESLRAEVTSPSLKATFLARKRRAFELAIDVRMALARKRPGTGYAEAALELAERAKARTLLDLLREADAEPVRGVAPELLERRIRLERRLQAMAARQVELLGRGSPVEAARPAERELEEILVALDAVEAEIRRRSPRQAALARPRLLAADEIRALLDAETLLLEIALGEERSHLWAVTSERVEAHELPGRERLDLLARAVAEDLATRAAGTSGAVEAGRRAELSALVLGPVAHLLGDRRLVVVAEGALQYVPFSALPRPGTDGEPEGGEPLLVRHEILSLPSASVLAELRRAARETPRARKLRVAVLADPVFSATDPRVASAPPSDLVATAQSEPEAAGSEPERSGSPADRDFAAPTGLVRLPATRREAEAIASLVPEGSLSTALDFETSRERVLETDWSPFSVIHFATHGVIDAEIPALSGLVLSLVDAAGRPQPGFLSLGDIYGLSLEADLVVLSGCETALGRELRGEGLVGLTQGFLQAGAGGLAASLWRVQDRATAELMERFYRGLLDEGLRPSAALAEAQRSLYRERRWRDPYYWAPFVFQGDWRSRVAPEGEMIEPFATGRD